MKFKVVEKEENAILNPDFYKEKTLRLQFDGNYYLKGFDLDIPSVIGHGLKYAFAVASFASFMAGQPLLGTVMAAIPVIDCLGRAMLYHDKDDGKASDQISESSIHNSRLVP